METDNYDDETQDSEEGSDDGTELDGVLGSADNDEDDRILKEIKDNVKKSKDHLTNWFNEAREAYDYFAGRQWTEEDTQKLDSEGRPHIVFNRIPRVINAITGLEVENRTEVVYTPRQTGDAMASDILTGAAQYVRDNCDAEDEESQAFKDCLICGIGWTETHINYEVNPDGEILIERADPLDMHYDCTATKRNLSDMEWVAREKHYTKRQFKSMWPDADANILNDAPHSKGLQPHDATEAPWYRIDQSGKDGREHNKICVIQYQKWSRVKFYRVERINEQTGESDIVEMDQKTFDDSQKMINVLGLKCLEQYRRVYKQYFVAGNQVLDKGDCPVNMFTFRAITGMLDRNKNYWKGMISLMRDPQMWSNKWLSQTLHIFNTNAKGGYIVEEGVFTNPRQSAETLSTSSVTYVVEGALGEGRLQKKEAPVFPPGLDNLLQYATSSVSELVGVNLESLGMANRDQSGVLEAERKRTTITMVADFFDALRRYRKEQARVLADFIISYISDGRLVRIAGQGLGKYVPLMKDRLDFAYDIVVDDALSSPHQKERVFAMVIQLLPTLLQAGIPIPPEVLDYAPLPAPLIEDWRKLLANQSKDQTGAMKEQIRMQLAQLELAKGQMELAKGQQEIKSKQAAEVETKTNAVLNVAKFEHESALAVRDAANMQDEQLLKRLELGFRLAKEV